MIDSFPNLFTNIFSHCIPTAVINMKYDLVLYVTPNSSKSRHLRIFESGASLTGDPERTLKYLIFKLFNKYKCCLIGRGWHAYAMYSYCLIGRGRYAYSQCCWTSDSGLFCKSLMLILYDIAEFELILRSEHIGTILLVL